MNATSNAMFDSLEALGAALSEQGNLSAEYMDKMIHKVPEAPSVNRVAWLTQRLKGKTVLHVGCAGPLHGHLKQVCARLYGVDRVAATPGDLQYACCDIEEDQLPVFPGVEAVLLGEVLEHLLAPGPLLKRIHAVYPGAEIVATVPNAFSEAGRRHMERGVENVNREHVCYYSYWTLRELLRRCGYVMQELLWYNGAPRVAEGIIMVARAR